MVNLIVKDIKNVPENFRKPIEELLNEKREYFSNYFKKYDKPLTMEVIFKQTSSLFTVSVSLNMKSKKILSVEEGNEILKVVHKLFAGFRKTVKRQYELEKKTYLYKRKRNRK
jgi:ribosome-associated translation inhibitor RaiA